MRKMRILARRLVGDTRALAMTEFAMAAPLVLAMGLWGMESANLAIAHMRVSQIALHIADNGSRIGDLSTLNNRKIYEDDLNDLLEGAKIQGGSSIDLFTHGRVIISSLEVVPGTENQQYIHWQRCRGNKVWSSHYGNEGDGLTSNTLDGMGPKGEEVEATKGEAVIFVEVSYDYQPLVTNKIVNNPIIHVTAAYNVRDDRDLSKIYQRDPSKPSAVAQCLPQPVS